MELTMRIELMTSPLPRECSTTEPREPIKNQGLRTNKHQNRWSGRQGSNLRHQPWKGCTLPTELRPHLKKKFNGGERWIRTIEGINRQIYSLLPLATRQSLLNISALHSLRSVVGAGYRDRTYDLRFTKPLLYQLS